MKNIIPFLILSLTLSCGSSESNNSDSEQKNEQQNQSPPIRPGKSALETLKVFFTPDESSGTIWDRGYYSEKYASDILSSLRVDRIEPIGESTHPNHADYHLVFYSYNIENRSVYKSRVMVVIDEYWYTSAAYLSTYLGMAEYGLGHVGDDRIEQLEEMISEWEDLTPEEFWWTY